MAQPNNEYFPVRDFMDGVLLHADIKENLMHAARLLDQGANAILVREGGIPSGIITSIDIVRGVLKIKKDPSEVTLGDVMSTPVKSISATEDIQRARELMLDHSLRKVPVLDPGEDVVGLLVVNDFLRNVKWAQKFKL